MRSSIFLILAIIWPFAINAQIVQKGIVKEYNEKAQKTPLSGVELNVRSANSTVSDQNGDFSLSFLTLKPGEKVNVRRIEKLGYEVFNKEAIEQWNLNPTNAFVIIMCKSDKFKRIRDNYERVSSESYAKQLKKEEAALAKLKDEGKLKEEEYQRQLYILREEYENQLDNLDSYIDRFSRIDLSELSAIEQDIIELVQTGRIEEAIAKYEEQNYVEKYAKEVTELREVSEAMEQLSIVYNNKIQSRDSLLAAINRQIETLKIAGGKENFEKINQLLHDIAYADTTDVNQMIAYSQFAIAQNKNNEALAALRIIKRIRDLDASDDDSVSKCIVVRRNIGNVYFSMDDFNNAEKYYLEAIKICNEYNWLDKSYPLTHIEVCETELGRLYSAMKDFDKSEALLLSTLERKLNNYYSDNNDHTIFELTDVYRELSAFYVKKQDFSKAIKYGIKSLNYFNELNDKESVEHTMLHANITSDVAVAYYYVTDVQSAIKYILLSLDSRKKLYEYNPEKYGLDLAMSYGNLGNMYSMIGDNNKAFENAEQCHTIISELYHSNPNTYSKEYAMSTYNMATEFIGQSDYAKGLDMLMDLLPTVENLYGQYPEAYSKFFVETLHISGLCEHNLGEYENCHSHLDRAINIIEKCNTDYIYTFLEPKINIFTLKGDTYKQMGSYDNAIEYYKKAIECAEVAESINKDSFIQSRISAYYNLGLLYIQLNMDEDAVKIFNRLKSKFSIYKIPQNELILYNLAKSLYATNEYQQALEIIEEGLELFPDSEGLWHLKEIVTSSF